MTNNTILVLGGTGKTGRRLAVALRRRGAAARTAARRNADVAFDWDDPTTYDAALRGVDRVYLVPPGGRLDYAGTVAGFLDRAEAAGVRHVTQLSARGVDHQPAEVAPRAVELDLAHRPAITHAVLRPGWFMQNFDEAWFRPVRGRIEAPTGEGAEAFVHVDDIVEVAAATLLAPADHDGAGYTLTGPEALTFAQVAARISTATGEQVLHNDIPRTAWVDARVAEGMPRDYAELLARLLDEGLRASIGAATTPTVAEVTGHPARPFIP